MLEMEHQKLFYLGYTPRSPWFRGYIMNYVSIHIDELERSPLFTFFMCPKNLTSYGEEHLSEIIDIFENRMEEYEYQNGMSIARSCYIRPREMNTIKLGKILAKITRECENMVRVKNHLPNVGEGFIEETKLYQKIKLTFPEMKIIHHGKPPFLGR